MWSFWKGDHSHLTFFPSNFNEEIIIIETSACSCNCSYEKPYVIFKHAFMSKWKIQRKVETTYYHLVHAISSWRIWQWNTQ